MTPRRMEIGKNLDTTAILASMEVSMADDRSLSELREVLGKRIDELIATNFNLLAALLYQMDVDEAKIKAALQNTRKDESPGQILAELVIARQLEKLKWRRKYKA